MIKTIIVDIDGTVMNNDHRQGYLERHPKNWSQWEKNMHHDTPYEDIIWLVKVLVMAGCKCVFVTGRNAKPDVVATTKRQLDEVAGLKGFYDKLYMKDADDNRPDNVVKIELFERVKADGFEGPFMAIDDRDRVVKMWRELGIRCLQVRDGAY